MRTEHASWPPELDLDASGARLHMEARDLPGGDGQPLGAFFDCDREWRTLMRWTPDSEDGRAAEVQVSRWPAIFARVVSGDLIIGFGSGHETLALADLLARAIAAGMAGVTVGTERVR